MNARELFEVLVRVLGIWQFVGGLELVPQWLRMSSQPQQYAQLGVSDFVLFLGPCGMRIGFGLALFFGARWLAGRIRFGKVEPALAARVD